ncbi:Unknown protein [Striga hermonthica]|uniref:Uncharacterized protein n=1 Tax=Striga hermonthica TaxID=68872 RepID=A0A9N7R569_STRHE|nr:Unknown protein [Striga hermonthica]
MSSGLIVNAVFLQDEKLRRLAQLIRNHEVNNMFYITFASVGEQLQYLRMVNDNLASVHTILDDANAVVHRHRGDPVRSHVAGLVHAYVEHSLNNALQLIPNYTVRRDYLDKMIEHHEAVYEALETLNTSNLDAVDELTETIRELDRILISYMRLTLNSYASA